MHEFAETSSYFHDDIAAVSSIEGIPSILDIICSVTGMGFAVVARVTDNHWVACSVRDEMGFGLQTGGELKIETTFCRNVRRSRQPIIIDDVAKDAQYRRHPIPQLYNFQSYISVPIVLSNGDVFGTLCAIDSQPAQNTTTATIHLFKQFADLIAFHLQTHYRLVASESALADERHIAEVREQFIAVLGHDLRNPLASIGNLVELVEATHKDQEIGMQMQQVKNSVKRMSNLIDTVIDFAHGRLGGGFTLSINDAQTLKPVLEQVIIEQRATNPDCKFDVQLAISDGFSCDSNRIGQLMSNLLGNAVTYGAPGAPVRVTATTIDNVFELSVSNIGEPIDAETKANLFKPFWRPSIGKNQQGLGLGLYIASEIAKAHNGTLEVESTPSETRFTFRMPMAPQ